MHGLENIEFWFSKFVSIGIIIVELIGVLALFWAVGVGVLGFFKQDRQLRLKLAEGLSLSLEFKIGSELLRTVIVRNFSELLILGSVILLRAALAYLIEREIKAEREHSP